MHGKMHSLFLPTKTSWPLTVFKITVQLFTHVTYWQNCI